MCDSPLRLRLDRSALVHNWQWLDQRSGAAACGAAIKADGYGLGAGEVMRHLSGAGCRDFFVATWAEANALGSVAEGLSLSVFHGVRAEDMAAARAGRARPVLNTREQVQRWKDGGGGLCDVMVDTGMNRLGVAPVDIAAGLLDGLMVETLLSHLACADEDVPMNAAQCTDFAALKGRTGARRMSLANSAGICLGGGYAFDLTRPGLALYGGVPRMEAAGHIRQVATPEAQILQRRRVGAGGKVGYNATFIAERDMELAILNIGYADGYLRGFSGSGHALAGQVKLPVLGRVSMDLLIVNVDAAPDLGEGDWVSIGYDLPEAATASGLSQYELLTGLGPRFNRYWG
ncbi:alanine racemase [Sphingomonas cavernae]|uniref:alanine racemase n=1 Tax=Sphingomonas cavernae TaxID=2320861 RepID=A0A418W816_9SPHN|nr:alanine racemase [Sphingomonas cavernae]RJF86148.1 alanine racemase [Sphingomonas cavernae]